MTYQNERQMSTRASKFPIEEHYTNIDINPNEEIDPRYGVTYEYPVRWANDPSLNKAIGIRRLDCIPTAHIFTLTIWYYKPVEETDEDGVTNTTYTTGDRITKKFAVTKNNTLLEIINLMCEKLSNDHYSLAYNYSDDGTLTLKGVYQDENMNTQFIIQPGDNKGNSAARFLQFLNQKTDDEHKNILFTESLEKTFTNVWDRENLEFHASFSTSKRGFIGLKGDFYPNISYIFNQGTDSPQFQLRFTTNGKDPILPIYSHFICQLTFILNYKKSLVT